MKRKRSETPTPVRPVIRTMDRRDFVEVVAIEYTAFEHHWSYQDFVAAQEHPNNVCRVAELDDAVAGYMIYKLARARLELVNLAVAAPLRRQGIATALLDKLKSQLSQQRRTRITAPVRERNLAGQLLLRACGFRCVEVLHGTYDESDEDAYLFRFRHRDLGLVSMRPAGLGPLVE